jgi:hypothetical protein
MTEGSGGLAAVSIGLSPWLVVIILLVVAVGVWKLAKFVWAMFG